MAYMDKTIPVQRTKQKKYPNTAHYICNLRISTNQFAKNQIAKNHL